jgi:hypothetical protein
MHDLKTVFIHELGHYTSHILNKNIFNHGEGVEKMKICRYSESSDEYRGMVKSINFTEEDLYYMPQAYLKFYIARTIYGCVFQSYYLEIDIEICLSNNGWQDSRNLKGVLKRNKKLNKFNSLVNILSKDHIYELKHHKILDLLKDINPKKYLQLNEDCFIADKDKIEELINSLIPKLDSYYNKW